MKKNASPYHTGSDVIEYRLDIHILDGTVPTDEIGGCYTPWMPRTNTSWELLVGPIPTQLRNNGMYGIGTLR